MDKVRWLTMISMRAMLLESPGPIAAAPLRLVERPVPEPWPGEVLIRVKACGVCHTDLHTVEGELPLPHLPLIPGHQVMGIIESWGRGSGLERPLTGLLKVA